MPTDYKQDEYLERSEEQSAEAQAAEVTVDSQQAYEYEAAQPETYGSYDSEQQTEAYEELPAETYAEEPAENLTEQETQFAESEVYEAEPVYQEIEPVYEDTDAVYQEAEPVYQETEPVYEEGEAVYQEAEPVYAETEPVYTEEAEAVYSQEAESEYTEYAEEVQTVQEEDAAPEETEPSLSQPGAFEAESPAPEAAEPVLPEAPVSEKKTAHRSASEKAAIKPKKPKITHERGSQLPQYGGFDYTKAFARNARVNELLIRKLEWQREFERAAEQYYRELHRIPGFVKAGNTLYMLGFWVEYSFVVLSRILTRLVRFGIKEALFLLTSLLTPIVFGITMLSNGIEEFILAPVRRFFLGLARVRAVQATVEDVQEGRRNARKHFWQGILRYWPMVRPAASWLVPAAALAMLLTVTSAMLDSTFILAVKVDGNTIGYVQNQQDFEGAKEDVSERVDAAKRALAATGNEISDEEWNIDVTYSLATEATRTGSLMSQNAMANAILEASSDQIQNGTAVYIDGILQGILSQEDNVRFARYLADNLSRHTSSESYLALLENPELTNVRCEYIHEIVNGEEENGVYFTSSITDYNTFIERLEDTSINYRVQSWDTLWTIADTNGITVEELCALNGIEPDYEPATGSIMNVGNHESLLAVRQKATITWHEEIDFDSVEEKSRELGYGLTKTVQEGEKGVKELIADIVYVDGQEESRVVTGETILKEPVTEIIQKGTKLSSGLYAQTGSGNFLWPVPNYTYVSRWMGNGHNGTDICAPYGVDVLACDAGVVITAGWHWSYGNYVVIDHGNGWQTLYGHNSQLCVSAGQPVSQGTVIAKIGSTGYSTGNHCHLEFRYNGSRVSAYTVFGGAPR